MNAVILIVFFLAILFAIVKPLGLYMYRVYAGERTFVSPVLQPVERSIYRLTGVDASREMSWTTYAGSLLLFSAVTTLFSYVIMRSQGGLPLNPRDLPGVEERLAFNTSVSFATNTN